MKPAALFALFIMICLFLSGCQSAQLSDVREETPTEAPTATPLPQPTLVPDASPEDKTAFYRSAVEREDLALSFSAESGFYTKDVSLSITAEGATDIYYTDDGSAPGPNALHYTRPVPLTVTDAELPRCAVIRAVAYYPDGTKSPVFTRTLFLNTHIKKRFSMPVFSIVAPPDELTSGPNALLVGSRALDTGKSASRTVLLQVYDKNGLEIINQFATLRVYGGESRKMAVKSLQLTPVTAHEGEEAVFTYPFFDTVSAEANTVDAYRQLVLSNGEDDFQYAFIRDELAHQAARLAGFPDFEETRPAVVYINGEYYGLHWLHDVYGNAYFHALYDVPAGYYAVIDWNDKTGAAAAEEGAQEAARVFQAEYQRLLGMDLTAEEGFDQLQRFLDVENYLNYCALNIYLNNENWPSQMQLYAYIPDDGSAQDAQWRALPHGMDHSFGLKAGKDGYSHDTLAHALTPDDARYAPLFAKLMERADCRAYFVNKMTELMNETFAPQAMLAALRELNGVRKNELQHYFTRIEKLRKVRNSTIWMKKSDYDAAYRELTGFIENRPAAVLESLAAHLPVGAPDASK